MTTQTDEINAAPENTCLFCRIASGAVPAALTLEDEECVAFRDINPQAPVHFLVIPRRHISALSECGAAEVSLLGHLLEVAARIARQAGADPSGYRVVVNCGRDGGQSVSHLHLHVLAGRPMTWPPG